MIKIIGEALEAVQRAVCRNCDALLEYVDADTQRYDGQDYSGGSDGRIWIVCPRCKKEVVVRSW